MPLKEGSEIYEIPTRMETRNQLYGYADPQKQIIGSVIIGVILLTFVNKKSHCNPYIIVVQYDGFESETYVMEFLKNQVLKCTVKSKTAQKGLVELNLDVRLKDENTDFINALANIKGVSSAVLVSYNGEYMG